MSLANKLEASFREYLREIVREELAEREGPSVAQPDDPSPISFSEAEFCQRVGMSRAYARQLRREGKLKFIRVHAREVRYTPEHERAFLASRR